MNNTHGSAARPTVVQVGRLARVQLNPDPRYRDPRRSPGGAAAFAGAYALESGLRPMPLLLAGCRGASTGADRSSGQGGAPDGHRPASGAGPDDWFIDRARETGLDFVHVNGMSGQLYFPEMMGPGVALFDHDNDGDLDVYFVQGRMLGSSPSPDGETTGPPGGRLFRNDLSVNPDGTRTLRFTDVTDSSGIAATGYGMGVATGDFNNDGCADLYLTAFGRNCSPQHRTDVHRRLEACRRGR